jgi:DNA-binding CsgD family transcriptional regulator
MAEALSERDLRALFGVIEAGRRGEPTEGIPWEALDGLASLVACDAVSLSEFDAAHGKNIVFQSHEAGDRVLEIGEDPHDPAEFWTYVNQFAPCTYPHRTGDLASVVRWSDFYTNAELHNSPLFVEFYALEGRKYGLHASFPTLPGQMRKITFWRNGDPDFTERDRLVVELLRPHLWEVYLAAQQRRHRVPQLSKREWEVLHLAHEGYGNAQIAQRLFVSVATVRKHMEHIFDRTGTRTRTSAAALMIPHHGDAAQTSA